jgi:hypothetical protein
MKISPIAGVRKTAVGSVVWPGTWSHLHPAGSATFGSADFIIFVSAHFSMQ